MSERVKKYLSVLELSYCRDAISFRHSETDFLFYNNIMENEIWKDVIGYEGLYQVSNLGNVRGLDRKVNGKYGNIANRYGRVLVPSKKKTGYLGVTFSIEKEKKYYSIHRLVAITFLPNPKNKPQVNHKDGDKANNKLSNLEWVTQSENGLHAYKNGLCPRLAGGNARNRKLSEKPVKEIRHYYLVKKYSIKELACKYFIGISTVHQIINYKTWKTI